VTFVDERALHAYPLSGVFVRVIDYTVVSTGKQLETTTVHERAVVTFNGTADVPMSRHFSIVTYCADGYYLGDYPPKAESGSPLHSTGDLTLARRQNVQARARLR